MEGNYYARQVAGDYQCDVLDLHYVFRNHLSHRVGDGVHWDHLAHRRISNMVLTHIAESWGLPLPGRDRLNVTYRVSLCKDFFNCGMINFTMCIVMCLK